MPKIVIALAGEIACGKGTVTEYLVNEYNADSLRYSTILRDVLDRLYIDQNRKNMQTISTFFRKAFGEDILSKAMLNDIKHNSHEIVVLDGARRINDLELINELPGFKLIYVEATMDTRYKRITNRDENSDDKAKSFKEFEADNQLESEVQIRGLKKYADFVLDNNGNQQQLNMQIEETIKQII